MNYISSFINTESCLCYIINFSVTWIRNTYNVTGFCDQYNFIRCFSHCTDHFVMTFMANQYNQPAFISISDNPFMYCCNKWTGCINNLQFQAFCVSTNFRRNTMCRKNYGLSCWNLIKFIDKNNASVSKVIYHCRVVYNLFAYIKLAIDLAQHLINNRNCSINTCTKPSGSHHY